MHSNVTTFLLGHVLILLAFLAANMSLDFKTHYGTSNTPTNKVYYTVMTHSTTGFGDITPKSRLAKWLTTVHIILVWIFTLVSATLAFE